MAAEMLEDFMKEDRIIEDAENDPTPLYITYESLFPHGAFFQDTNFITLQDGTYPVRHGTIRADNKHSYDEVTIENFRIKKFVKYYPQGSIKGPLSIDYYKYIQGGMYEMCHCRRVGGKVVRSITLYYKPVSENMAMIAEKIADIQKSPNVKKVVYGANCICHTEYRTIDIYFHEKDEGGSS